MKSVWSGKEKSDCDLKKSSQIQVIWDLGLWELSSIEPWNMTQVTQSFLADGIYAKIFEDDIDVNICIQRRFKVKMWCKAEWWLITIITIILIYYLY